jgi:hypothetical protein
MKKILLSIFVISSLAVIIAFNTNGNYTVVNKTDLDITTISISPSGDNFSGSESFSTTIPKGESFSIDYSTKSDICSYDVKFKDNNGQEFIVNDVELCSNNVIILATNKAETVPQVLIQPAR